ncbi:MAG: hypothetical protein COB61_012210 [Thiotrichales bacterium]|nr:hypothetical protein [Thiotrichales bacterium]
MKNTIKTLFVASTLFISQQSFADTAFGIGVGTLGGKLQLAQSLTKNTNLRLEYNGANYNTNGATSGVDYDLDLELSSVGLLFDWHLLNNSFRITLGGLYNDNGISAVSSLGNSSFEVGNMSFTSAQVGRLEGDIEFNTFAPYLGIGWGRAVHKGYSFNLDIGVVMQGNPEVNLSSIGGTLSNNTLLLNEIEAEERELQNDLDNFDLYPVISLGVNYTF